MKLPDIGRTQFSLTALASLNGLMAVVTGAFGAHAIHDPAVRELLRTGAQYQLVHAAAAIAVLGAGYLGARERQVAAGLFGVGGMVFGGSLDLLALTHARPWGGVAPLGGLLMIVGWSALGWTSWKAHAAH